MTKEQTKYIIKVHQAFVDGKKIEYTKKGSLIWYDCNDPDWNWTYFDYRIKKTKLEIGKWYLNPKWSYPVKLVAIDLTYYVFMNNIGKVHLIIDNEDFSDFEETCNP